jgi:hypothetical protein
MRHLLVSLLASSSLAVTSCVLESKSLGDAAVTNGTMDESSTASSDDLGDELGMDDIPSFEGEAEFVVVSHACGDFSSASGGGEAGGEIIELCGKTNPDTGAMSIRARKYDGSSFGDRPYQVRVSSPADDPCAGRWNFVVATTEPLGIGTPTLTFTFPSQWFSEQTHQSYCVTASVQPGDIGYDPNNPQQQAWWWSGKVTVMRTDPG